MRQTTEFVRSGDVCLCSGVQVPVACICDNSSAPLHLESGGPALELELVARALSAAEDQRHVQFRGTWARAAAPPCAARRRLAPPGTRVHLIYPYRLRYMLK